MFEGDVEIDESLFGRKIKYNKGEPKGHRIWIFGMIERSSNTLIIYPVDKRDAATLIPIIQRHVYPGSRIFSDSWGAYLGLNELGYSHYTVVHKTNFKQNYQCFDTGEIVQCHTNQIEGAWKHCKDHFRKINGTNTKLFEQHLAEIVWRNHISNSDKYTSFFELVKTIYPLNKEKTYTYPTPLFNTWTPPDATTERRHHISIAQISDIESNTESDDNAHSGDEERSADEVFHPSQNASGASGDVTVENKSTNETTEGSSRISHSPEGPKSPLPSTSEVKDRYVTKRRKRKPTKSPSETTGSEKVKGLCCPKDFQPLAVSTREKSGKQKRKEKRKSNPYSKSKFVYNLTDMFTSSDSDFQ